MDINKLSQSELDTLKRHIAAENGRKGGLAKTDKKRRAGQANIAKASKRLAEIRAAKRILAGKPANATTMTEGT